MIYDKFIKKQKSIKAHYVILLFKYYLLSMITLIICNCSDKINKQSVPPEEPWEKYYKVAEEAINNQRYDIAEKNELLSIAEATRINGITKDTGISFNLWRIYMMQGRYAEAAIGRKKALPFYKDQYLKNQKSSADISSYYGQVGESYLAWGKWNEAKNSFEEALAYADKLGMESKDNDVNKINARFKINVIYPLMGEYYIQQANYQKARQYLEEALDSAINFGTISQNIAIAKNRLAMAYYYAGDDQKAEELFGGAAGLNEKAIVGFPEDLAKSLTMLGRIAEHNDQSIQAQDHYQSAREALHMYRTVVRKVEEADVCFQIGRFYFMRGYKEEAARTYIEAIALRQATGTATHPNCADAHKGLADVAAYKNELTSATAQAAQALAILDKSVVPTHPRIAPVLVALASINILAGNPQAAAPLNARLETILQKPLGPWKEDFLDTTAFYAGLLKKAGKPAEAELMNALHARQKERR